MVAAPSSMRSSSSAAPSLLLLPAPPRLATRSLLHAAYRVPLTAVLARLSRARTPQVLIVAVAGSVLVPGSTGSPGSEATDGPASASASFVRWRSSQALLAELYAIIAAICDEHDIAADLGSDEPGSVDARIVLIHHEFSTALQASSPPPPPPSISCRRLSRPVVSNGTAVLDLAAFAATVRPWSTAFHVSSEPGYELLSNYLTHAEGRQKLLQSQMVSVDGGMSFSNRGPTLQDPANKNCTLGGAQEHEGEGEDAIRGHGVVCLGGTFDHLHPGHKLLLQAAVLLLRIPEGVEEPCTIVVGISNNELLAKKLYAEEVQAWDVRARSVIAFLSTEFNEPTTTVAPVTSLTADGVSHVSTNELRATFCGGAVLVRCVDIHDPFGPTISEEAIDAIVVSGETRSGGCAINDKRTARGWRPLEIYEIDVLDATPADGNVEGGGDQRDSGHSGAVSLAGKISSTEIRRRKAEARRRLERRDEGSKTSGGLSVQE